MGKPMSAGAKIEVPQLVAAIVLLGIAVTRISWSDFASKADATFLALVAVGLALLVFPLKTIKSLKAGGIELSLDAPNVKGAVASLDLSRVEDVKLRGKLQMLSHVLPVVTGSRLLWIDDRPETIIGERRLLRALGVTIVPAKSSDEARELLRADGDFDLIVSDVQRRDDTHKVTGGVDIHEGVNFIVWLRTQFGDRFVKEIPVIFYAAYDWPRLVDFTRPARETLPEPGISNSVVDLVPKVLLALAESRDTIRVPSKKTPTDV
jgi:CheY-like chemotaxis protein